ncbi:MAG: ATP-dependent helicase [Candidatus Pacebacteria bacterium]|nr:ATP-dependent helicase [Candidatus Paceibacterota bacterium]
MPSTPAFDEAYKGLTKAQKQAVDTVEGPVLVIAGPGTGKTHILTLRIANILLKTQASPSNILVLTFTDSAARTVRMRLRTLVGETVARDVLVSTFHGFAEHLLRTHASSFPLLEGRRLMGDVENTLLWRDVIANEDIKLLRHPKTPFLYLKDLAGLQRDLVRERISLEDYQTWIEEETARTHADESLRYVKGEKKGEMKATGISKLERMEKASEAILLMEAYEAYKQERGVYDFADMLRGVVDTLQEDANLRAELQETYQYILADEHQDANALQHALLDTLAYDEHPNLFVVGDEKQAIFRFQGADATHFEAFTEHYPRTVVIPLTDSFRSLQSILDHAHALATEHLPTPHETHAELSATRKGDASISLLESPDPLAERDQVAGLIEEAIQKGTKPHEIAVIASRNSTATLMSEHLKARGIETLRAGDMMLESRPLLRSVLALMRAIANPLDMASLRESLLGPWFDVPLAERASLLLRNRDHELLHALSEEFPEPFHTITTLQKDALATPALTIFSRMLEESGIRGYVLGNPEHLVDDLPLLRKLMMHVEDMIARDTNATFSTIVSALTDASEQGLAGVKSSILQREGQVTVITAHKAKGMEFEKVFIVGLTANEWEKGGKSPLIPSPIDMRRTLDDVLRQFYVALTRAKDEIVLSYAKESGEGKERAPSMLIPEGLPRIAPSFDPLPRLHTTTDAPALVRTLTKQYLTEEGLSPSAMQEYLESPPRFFAKRVLRLREPETYSLTIGNAVHAGIATFLSEQSEDKAFGTLEVSLRKSLLPRDQAFEHLARDVRARLHAFIVYRAELGDTIAIEKGYSLTHSVLGSEVRLFGKVDALFESPDGEVIVDFKTSTNVKADDTKFEHQLAFYDFVLRGNEHSPVGAQIVQVGSEEVKAYDVLLTDNTRSAFKELLDTVIEEMLSGKWREGEPSPYDDILKLFA